MNKDELFRKRVESFGIDDATAVFNVACVAEALDTIAELKAQNIGGDTVEQRAGEYKSWDPEIFRVDKDCEDGFRRRLEERGFKTILLSEEAGRVEINMNASGESFFCVADPFDGSYLFKRGIEDFWFSSLAFYDKNFNSVSACVGDAAHQKVAFTDGPGAFIAEVNADRLEKKFKLDAEYRKLMGRPDVTELEVASIASYAMKPKKFMFPLVDKYRQVMEPFKFLLPNGGPYGFGHVAEGKIDCYFAVRQPYVDVFSGIAIAQNAGCIVTDFAGDEVKVDDNSESLHDVLTTTNETLHNKVLELIKRCQ